MSTASTIGVSPAEYLEFERRSEIKHEYRDGKIVETTGATREHNLIESNLLWILTNALRDKAYEVYPGNMRVKAAAAGLYTYPDAAVVKGEPQLEDEEFDTLLNPIVLFEILSPSTESYDRGEKFANSGTIESLLEYILISQDKQRVERFTRKDDGEWGYRAYNGPEAIVELTAIDCSLKLSDIYHKVLLEAPPAR